jgi:hypothetical protein
VTGTAALFINTPGLLTNEDVRQKLQMTALDLGDTGKDEIFGYGLVNAAAASFATEVRLTITRISGSPVLGAELIRLAGIPYEISIENSGLNKVKVDVFEGDVLQKDLSDSFHFGDKKPQEVDFTLDASGSRYDVLFTPYGKSGNSADIVIKWDGGNYP